MASQGVSMQREGKGGGGGVPTPSSATLTGIIQTTERPPHLLLCHFPCIPHTHYRQAALLAPLTSFSATRMALMFSRREAEGSR